MANAEHKRNVDTILLYMLIKKLVLPIVRTKAYKLKLVNGAGKIIKEPQTKTERNALTVLDRFVFKLKRLLGSKLINLHKFLYTQTLNNDFYNKLIVKGTVEQRSEISRIKKDVKTRLENNNINIDDVLLLLTEDEDASL